MSAREYRASLSAVEQARFTERDATVIVTLREIMAERPENVAACAYAQYEGLQPGDNSYWVFSKDGSRPRLASPPVAPLCVVGVAGHRLGLTLEDLAGFEGAGAIEVLAAALGVSLHTESFTPVVSGAAAFAQECQDQGAPWGEVLVWFNTYLAGDEPEARALFSAWQAQQEAAR